MKIAIVLNAPGADAAGSHQTNGTEPSKDYVLLARSLDAMLITGDTKSTKSLVGRRFGSYLSLAWEAFRRRNEYDVVLTMSEQIGLPLALLFKLARCNKTHVMVSHYMTPRRKSLFESLLRLDSHIAKIVTYGSAQVDYLVNQLKIPKEKVELVLHPVDANFWKPMPDANKKVIVSAGLLARDYDTLLKAVKGLDAEVIIAAASPWVNGSNSKAREIESNVRFVRCSPLEMRELYARAQIVAVPLVPINNHAGSLVIYEAMAMGKAVVTTANGGNLDIVRGSETGVYVPPQDYVALRTALKRMLDNPEETKRMGVRAREVVEQGLNLDTYVHNITEVVREAYQQSAVKLQPSGAK